MLSSQWLPWFLYKKNPSCSWREGCSGVQQGKLFVSPFPSPSCSQWILSKSQYLADFTEISIWVTILLVQTNPKCRFPQYFWLFSLLRYNLHVIKFSHFSYTGHFKCDIIVFSNLLLYGFAFWNFLVSSFLNCEDYLINSLLSAVCFFPSNLMFNLSGKWKWSRSVVSNSLRHCGL